MKIKRVIKGSIYFVLVTTFLLSVLVTYVYFNQVKIAHFIHKQSTGRPVALTRILVFGIDEEGESKRADSIMLVSLDPSKNTISILSVPRDTYVEIPGRGMSKINHAHAYGGTALLKQTVSTFFDVPIHHVVKFSLKGIHDYVDEIGGVGIYIPKDMNYEDRNAGLTIALKKGYATLDGDKAVQFLRFRHDRAGDIGRIERQQQFFYALAKEVLYQNPLQIYADYQALGNSIYTSVSFWELLGVFPHIKAAVANNAIRAMSLPGHNARIKGVSYWVPELEDIRLEFEWTGFTTRGLIKEKTVKAKALNRAVPIRLFSNYLSDTELYEIKAQLEILNFNVLSVSKKSPMRVDSSQTIAMIPKENADISDIVTQKLYVDPAHVFHYDEAEEITLIIGSDWALNYIFLNKKAINGKNN